MILSGLLCAFVVLHEVDLIQETLILSGSHGNIEVVQNQNPISIKIVVLPLTNDLTWTFLGLLSFR